MIKGLKYGTYFLLVLIFLSTASSYFNHSLSLMPKEYKLVKKIFNRISLNNDLGSRPVSIVIRAGEDMHHLIRDIGICKDKKNYCFYFINLDPFKKYRGFRSEEVNHAIRLSYLYGHANASASPTGLISINRSSFRVLEKEEKFLASAIAHEMAHVMQFSPFTASLKTLKVSKKYPGKTDKDLNEEFLNQEQLMEAEADKRAASMLLNSDFPKETFLDAMEYFYKQNGIIHTKGQSKRHPDYITRINLIKTHINDKSFKKVKIKNPSAPLTWRYNRRENWLKFYPQNKKKGAIPTQF